MDYATLYNDLNKHFTQIGEKTDDNRFIYNRISVMRNATQQLLKNQLPSPDSHSFTELMAYVDEVKVMRAKIADGSPFAKFLEEAAFGTEVYIDHISDRAR